MRQPDAEAQYTPKRHIITNGWVEAKNSQLELLAHTFDNDDNITELTMRYELMCLMLDGTTEYKLIDELDLMPYKVTSGMIDNMNHFLFNRQKLYFISDLQPKLQKHVQNEHSNKKSK